MTAALLDLEVSDRGACPDAEDLVRFAEKGSVATERAALELHLARCGACLDTFLAFRGAEEDEELRRDLPSEHAAARMAARALALFPGTGNPGDRLEQAPTLTVADVVLRYSCGLLELVRSVLDVSPVLVPSSPLPVRGGPVLSRGTHGRSEPIRFTKALGPSLTADVEVEASAGDLLNFRVKLLASPGRTPVDGIRVVLQRAGEEFEATRTRQGLASFEGYEPAGYELLVHDPSGSLIGGIVLQLQEET
jgi:hypothetical protein